MEKKNYEEGKKLFITGAGFLVLGLFFTYGIAIFFGVVMMIAGMLPPSGDKNDPV